ncbi:MAG: hotdog fold thioesterase [Bowdeniella nasicola]|nr:hotdog fold thioesterase [Bowdeniella nasicola]
MSLTSPSLGPTADTNDLGDLAARLGMRVRPDEGGSYSSLEMPVSGNTQPFGLLHGGASAALAETAASLAARHDYPDSQPAGLTLTIRHLAAVRSGTVTASVRALSRAADHAVYEVCVRSEAGTLVALAELVCLVRTSSSRSVQ